MLFVLAQSNWTKYEQGQIQKNKEKQYLCLCIYITESWYSIEQQTNNHLPYTSQMEQKIASFKQDGVIIVQINVFFNWVPQEKLTNELATGNYAKLELPVRNGWVLGRVALVNTFFIKV